MKELVETLASEFNDKDYAHTYLEEFSNMEIAAQIKALREQRGLTQKELAELAGMKQERVSALEDVNYDSWTAKTLRKMARAFDVGIKISFETVSSRILDIDKLSKKELEKPSRIEDLKKLGNNGYLNKIVSPMWGEAVLTSNHNRVAPQSVPANDDWHSFPMLKTVSTKK